MANTAAIKLGLRVLHEAFPTREITKQTGAVFHELFRDTPDEDFLAACRTLATQRGRTFFPSPGEIAAMLTPRAAVDLDRLLEAISDQGQRSYSGFIYPRIERVRLVFGDAIASAYAFAGASRLWSNSETSRDIARREFREHLDTEAGPEIAPWLVGGKLDRLIPPPNRPARVLPEPKGPKGPRWTPLQSAVADVSRQIGPGTSDE